MCRFLFRCDVSPAIGFGHMRRCLTLARELKEGGAYVFFACRAADFDLAQELRHTVDDWTVLDWSLAVETDAQETVRLYQQRDMEVAVIDHYRVNVTYQEHLYRSGVRWLQFDWSAQQPLWADWVLSASPAAEESAYRAVKQREETCLLLGPSYALLRREFRQCQPPSRSFAQVRKILITFGGGDDQGVVLFCLEATKSLAPAVERIVLISSANPRLPEIRDWVGRNSEANVTLLVDETEIARCMAEADLAIIAGGTTTFETAAMGLPSLIIQLADNQTPNASAWARVGAAIYVGPFHNLRPHTLERQVMGLINDTRKRRSMSDAGRALVDGLGAQRVAQILMSGAKQHSATFR